MRHVLGALSFVTLGKVMICDFKFERTENYNFTITIHRDQHVEFFHSLIFYYFPIDVFVLSISGCVNKNESFYKKSMKNLV